MDDHGHGGDGGERDRRNQGKWERPENWTGLMGTYRSAIDSRLWVPKRRSALGWTINFGHRAGVWTMLLLLAVPLGLVALIAVCLTGGQ
jgi:uncharacterized membrane protein